MQAAGSCALVATERLSSALRRSEDLQIRWTRAGKRTKHLRSA